MVTQLESSCMTQGFTLEKRKRFKEKTTMYLSKRFFSKREMAKYLNDTTTQDWFLVTSGFSSSSDGTVCNRRMVTIRS